MVMVFMMDGEFLQVCIETQDHSGGTHSPFASLGDLLKK
jgi:hypothetical protein